MDEQDSKKARAHAHKPFKRAWRIVFGFLLAAIASIAVVAIIAWNYVAPILADTPDIDRLMSVHIAVPSVLLSANGTQLASYSQTRQERVDLARISPYVIQALIATEDHRFFSHRGVDVGRTLAAVLHTLEGDAQGGSTITQQLARNIFPEEIGRDRTIVRKLKEMATAVKIERQYSKQQILETYLNTVPFLYNIVGIEMAARTYYDKSAVDLNMMESATLIGMLKGTSFYNPVLQPGRAMKRRNVVLSQMVKHDAIARADYDAISEQPLQLRLNRLSDPTGSAPHFSAYVRKWLLDWAQQHGYNLYTDGLVITSTLDDRLQQAATEAVDRQAGLLQDIADVEWAQPTAHVMSHAAPAYTAIRKRVEPFQFFWNDRRELLDAFVRETPAYRKAVAAGQRDADVLARLKANPDFMEQLREAKSRLEAGFVAIDAGSGEVKAWVGSRDFGIDQFDHAGQAMRQPGSTFKPIVYGAALEAGMSPWRPYEDVPVHIRTADGGVWRPTDMSGWSGRIMPMREGLVYSRNGITAQVMRDIGVPSIIQFAQASGVRQSTLFPVPSLALGTSPVTLLEMVSTYSTIAGSGEYRPPLMIKRIADRHGNLLAEFHPEGQRAMSEQTADQLIDMMRAVVKNGTGRAVLQQVRVDADIAGKTGTTQNNTDGWFILMHPQLVAGAWIGFNDSRVTMRSDYWGQGGHNAVLLVGDFFGRALHDGLIDVRARFSQPVFGKDNRMDASDADNDQMQQSDGVITSAPGEAMTIIDADGIRGAPSSNVSGDLNDTGPPLERRDAAADLSPPETGRVPTQTDVNVW